MDDAPNELQGKDFPPQLAVWLRLVEAEFRSTWERTTEAALQKIRADLTTALAATDAKLAGTVQARLAESAERLGADLAAKVDASLALALEAGSAAPGDQPFTPTSSLLAEVRAVLARVAAEQAEVRSRLSQLEAGMVDVAEGVAAQLNEVTERLQAGVPEVPAVPGLESVPWEELQARLAAMEKAIGSVSGEKLASAISNGLAEATGRLRVDLAAVGREQAEMRSQLAKIETAVAAISDGKLTAAVNAALGDVTQRLREQVTAVGREQAAIRARLTEVTDKLGTQLAQFQNQTREQLASGMASSLGELTKRLGDEVTGNVSMLVGDLEATVVAAAERQAQAGKEQQGHLDTVVRQITDRVGKELETARKQTGAALQAALREASEKQTAAIRKTEEATRSEVLETITRAVEAQTKTLEEALMSLAKVVGDERRSSAALVRGSLGTTDQAVRELSQRLDEALATVIEASRQARAQATAAASEAKLARKSLTERRGVQA